MGDEVVIEIPKSSVSKASLLVYGVPLFAMIFGAILGDLLFSNELMSIFFSLSGMTSGLTFIHFYNRKLVNRDAYVPKMVLKVSVKVDIPSFESIKVKNIE